MSVAIKVEQLSKRYRIGLKEKDHDTLAGALMDWAKRPGQNLHRLRRLTHFSEHADDPDILWALKDVSFEIQQGEVVGVIGRNGAGKSTLLKILSRITQPTSGRVELHGRVSSLLEVGTGFHPELTGRENIYLNGTILGMRRKEIDKKFDEIVDFSGVEKFIDTPVKRYSSGMGVRLAFAVAAYLDPEILVVDEVLAVGDAAFQKKCLGKMGEVARQGRTVLFVSHQLDMIRSLCMHGILLQKGIVFKIGPVDDVVDTYLQSEKWSEKTKFLIDKQDRLDMQILAGRLVEESGKETGVFDVFSPITLEIVYLVTRALQGAVVNFEVKRNGATLFYSFDTDEDERLLDTRQPGHYVCRISLPAPLLKGGSYTISTNTGIINLDTFQHLEDILSFRVELNSKPSSVLSYADKRKGVIAMPLRWQVEKQSTWENVGSYESNHYSTI